MEIGALSMAMSQSRVQESAGIEIMKIVMDTGKILEWTSEATVVVAGVHFGVRVIPILKGKYQRIKKDISTRCSRNRRENKRN